MRMRRILSVVTLACVLASTVSCMEETMKETTPQAAITSFVIGYYKVRFHDKTSDGRDTIIYIKGSGSNYPMIIDQVGNRIYNADSLAYGSKVSGVTTSVTAVGTVVFSYGDEPDLKYLWSSYDSIDFTRPVIFSVISSDGSYTRDYSVKVNVHSVFPDSLRWKQTDSIGFTSLDRPYAAVANDSVYNFGYDASGILSVSGIDINGGTWSAPAALTGIPGGSTWSGNVVSLGGKLYAVFGTSLYGSSDGKSWSVVKDGVRSVIGNGSGSSIVCAVTTDSCMIRTTDMSEWKQLGKAPAGFPDSAAVSFDYPLLTNSSIIRTVLAAPGRDSLYASVWTINSTDTVWTQIDAPVNGKWRLPVMENLSVIRYDDCLFAFGAEAELFRQSNDNGITWYECDSYVGDYFSWNHYMQLPDGFKGYKGTFSYAVDRLGGIWIMTSDGRMWRGAITRLEKRSR